MRVVDLFAGCGGLSLGLEQAGFDDGIAVERSDMAAETHFRNFHLRGREWDDEYWTDVLRWDATRQALDAKTVVADIWAVVGDVAANHAKPSHVPDTMRHFVDFAPDLVAGGPPCQGFSMAGRRNPRDLRNKLPWAFLEFVRLTQPRAVVIENVVGINRAFRLAGSKAPFEQLRQALAATGPGYVVQPVELNAKHYGIPQNRPRMMLLAVTSTIADALGISVPSAEPWRSEAHVTAGWNPAASPLVPLPTHGPDEYITAGQALIDLDDCGYRIPKGSALYGRAEYAFARSMRTDDQRAPSPDELPNHNQRNHSERVRERFVLYGYLRDWGIPNSILGVHEDDSPWRTREHLAQVLEGRTRPDDLGRDGEDLVEVIMRLRTRKHTQRAIHGDMPAPTVVTLPDDYIHPSAPRVMTVRELARFQSFPDWFEFRSKETTGSHRRRVEVPQYSQVGNAVPPSLGYAVGRQLGALLKAYDSGQTVDHERYEPVLVPA